MPKILRTLSFTHSGVSYLGRIVMHRDDLREKSPEHRHRHTAAPPPQPLSRRSLAARQTQVTRGCKGDSVLFFQQETSVHCMHRPGWNWAAPRLGWAGLQCMLLSFGLSQTALPFASRYGRRTIFHSLHIQTAGSVAVGGTLKDL